MTKTFSKKWIPYFLIAPTLIYYIIFWLRPVVSAIYYSFFDDNNVFTINNYLTIFRDEYFKKAVINTSIFVVISVTLEFVVALGLALIINKKFKGAQVLLSIALIPMALPAVAVGAMWSSGFATYGWVNSLLYH
ncbi:MAG TPA: sugar ABC transporter permease, partial [Thermosipho africanus]|nr:sugar ABC transporter permease [Thermosipho africanus]